MILKTYVAEEARDVWKSGLITITNYIDQAAVERIIAAVKNEELQLLTEADKNKILFETRERGDTPGRDDLLRFIQVPAKIGKDVKQNLSGDKSQLFSRLRLHESHPYLLSDAEHLFGNKVLAENFINQQNIALQESHVENHWKYRHFLGYALGLKGSIEFPKIDNGARGLTVIIKKHLMFVQWIVKSLALYYDIKERNSIKRIQGLVKETILHPYVGALLAQMLQFLFQARLKAHHHYGSEEETLYLTEQADKSVFSLKQFPSGIRILKEFPTIYSYLNALLGNWQVHVKTKSFIGHAG